MSEQRSQLVSAVRTNSDAKHKLESLRPYRYSVLNYIGILYSLRCVNV